MKSFIFAAAMLAATSSAAVTPTVLVGIRPNSDGLCLITTPLNCEANILARETEIGRKFAIMSEYGPWDFTSIPSLEWAAANGRTPMYTWQHVYGPNNACILWSDVVAGVYDAQLTAQATYFASFPGAVIVRLLPEMNDLHQNCLYDVDNQTDPVTAGAEFQALWRHVYSVVHPIAENVIFDFSPGADAYNDASTGLPRTIWMDYYPGDDYVQWMGSELYNGAAIIGSGVQDSSRFNNTYDQITARGKPMILSETGAVNNETGTPDPQQRWFYSMSTHFVSGYPNIVAMVVFDVNANLDYRLTGSGETAFSNMAKKSYFSRMAP